MSVTIIRRAVRGYTHECGPLDIAIVDCPVCGIVYGIPERLRDNAAAKGRGEIQWYCPNGHRLGFHGKSAAEKAQEEARRQRDRAGRLAAERDQAIASERGQRAAKTRFKHERDRLRTRAAAGVCPCCDRSFDDLRDHMASQHPDFPTTHEEAH